MLLIVAALAFFAQSPEPRQRVTAASLPTGELLSEPVPALRFEVNRLTSPLTLIIYGDQRFTDPTNIKSTNPSSSPAARIRSPRHAPPPILNGDVLSGDVKNDYAVSPAETKPWRDAGLHVLPALVITRIPRRCPQRLENWWNSFPEMRNRRWYARRSLDRASTCSR